MRGQRVRYSRILYMNTLPAISLSRRFKRLKVVKIILYGQIHSAVLSLLQIVRIILIRKLHYLGSCRFDVATCTLRLSQTCY